MRRRRTPFLSSSSHTNEAKPSGKWPVRPSERLSPRLWAMTCPWFWKALRRAPVAPVAGAAGRSVALAGVWGMPVGLPQRDGAPRLPCHVRWSRIWPSGGVREVRARCCGVRGPPMRDQASTGQNRVGFRYVNQNVPYSKSEKVMASNPRGRGYLHVNVPLIPQSETALDNLVHRLGRRDQPGDPGLQPHCPGSGRGQGDLHSYPGKDGGLHSGQWG